MLMNVTSARVDLKAAAGQAERALERYAEPLAAIHGGVWPERLLELAWRRVVENSAHDSICGCSQDVVVDQVLIRFAEAEQIGRGIVSAAIDGLRGWAGQRIPFTFPSRYCVRFEDVAMLVARRQARYSPQWP
jgi:alpha-mannosidase